MNEPHFPGKASGDLDQIEITRNSVLKFIGNLKDKSPGLPGVHPECFKGLRYENTLSWNFLTRDVINDIERSLPVLSFRCLPFKNPDWSGFNVPLFCSFFEWIWTLDYYSPHWVVILECGKDKSWSLGNAIIFFLWHGKHDVKCCKAML